MTAGKLLLGLLDPNMSHRLGTRLAPILACLPLSLGGCASAQWHFAEPAAPGAVTSQSYGLHGEATADRAGGLPYANASGATDAAQPAAASAAAQPTSAVTAPPGTPAAPPVASYPSTATPSPSPPLSGAVVPAAAWEGPPPASSVTGNPAVPAAPPGPGEGPVFGSPLAGEGTNVSGPLQGPASDALPSLTDPHSFSSPPPEFPHDENAPVFRDRFAGILQNIIDDHRNYYSWTTAWTMLGAVSTASVLANTSIDQSVANWYQQQVRNSSTDSTAKVFKNFGEGGYMIPAAVGLWAVGEIFPDQPVVGTLGDYGQRVTRAYLVGGPPMLFMQYLLGSSRPSEDEGSSWHPFSGHATGVSGHAFISSVAFITAADMTDNIYLKGALYFGSTITGWSRINDNAHYLSQVVMGWSMGYVAVQAVDDTQQEHRRFQVEPMITPEMCGLQFIWNR